MAKRRALTDAAKDPAASKATQRPRQETASAPSPKPMARIIVSVAVGFIGGLLLGRFVKFP
jgi:hypothetical protein